MDLKSARLHNRLTQTELADAAGITQATIATLEKGIHPPRVSVARQIEQALGQRIDFPGYPQAQEYKNADTLITLFSPGSGSYRAGPGASFSGRRQLL
jgi:transcriptional regulator with XRE-family HTH domain